jgi:hypothetical protein
VGLVAVAAHRGVVRQCPALGEAAGTRGYPDEVQERRNRAWHGYADVFVGGRWVQASPTFDSALCRRVGVAPLRFDGVHDALLQAFGGTTTMTYVVTHGWYQDVPARFLAAEMLRRYPFARDHGVSRFKAAGPVMRTGAYGRWT